MIGGAGVLHGDIGDQVGAGVAVVHRGGGLDHLRAGQQGVFDFAQLDALPAQFDLAVGAAQIIQGARRRPAHQIPVRYIRAPAPPVRVGHEPFRGQPGPAHIAVRQRRPAQIQLTHHPGRGRVQPRIQHQRAHPRDRGADAQPAAPPTAAHR